jgi:hypothetical protein
MKWGDIPGLPFASTVDEDGAHEQQRERQLTAAFNDILRSNIGCFVVCEKIVRRQHKIHTHPIGEWKSSVWYCVEIIPTGTTLVSVDGFTDDNTSDVALPNLRSLMRTLVEYTDGATRRVGASALERDATVWVEQAAMAVSAAVGTGGHRYDNPDVIAAKASVPRLFVIHEGGQRKVFVGETRREDIASDAGAVAFVNAKASPELLHKLFVNEDVDTFEACTQLNKARCIKRLAYRIRTIGRPGDIPKGVDPYLYVVASADDAISIRISGAMEIDHIHAENLEFTREKLLEYIRYATDHVQNTCRIGGVLPPPGDGGGAGPSSLGAGPSSLGAGLSGADVVMVVVDDPADPAFEPEDEEYDDEMEVTDTADEWSDDDIPLALRATTEARQLAR